MAPLAAPMKREEDDNEKEEDCHHESESLSVMVFCGREMMSLKRE